MNFWNPRSCDSTLKKFLEGPFQEFAEHVMIGKYTIECKVLK